MNAIAIELDRKLQSSDPATAASLEQLVRRALELAEQRTVSNGDAVAAHRAHIAAFAGIWAGDDFNRPPQGEFEKREEW